MSEGRPLRDLLVQVLATVMIPVTVAGTGLYYTRWQQNLNDLKTMIDLVSDQTPEKRKYGVAMFEYLLKNDKVPVEFVAAQLAYANSSTDRELLPLMEQALLKASLENAKVADTFRQALERMPSRMFVHAMNENQRACIRYLMTKVPDAERSNLTLPGYSRATWSGPRHELRVFRQTDLVRGQEIVMTFRNAGLPLEMVDLSGNADIANKARPNTFEMWLGRSDMPASCPKA